MGMQPRQISSVLETGIEAWDYNGVDPAVARQHMQEIVDRDGEVRVSASRRNPHQGLICLGGRALDAFTTAASVVKVIPMPPRVKDWEQRQSRRGRRR